MVPLYCQPDLGYESNLELQTLKSAQYGSMWFTPHQLTRALAPKNDHHRAYACPGRRSPCSSRRRAQSAMNATYKSSRSETTEETPGPVALGVLTKW